MRYHRESAFELRIFQYFMRKWITPEWEIPLDLPTTISLTSEKRFISWTRVVMFYLIDKPIGMTSFDVIRKLRKQLHTKKLWHTGTLDPLASGCLLIASEGSTKLIVQLEHAEKRYSFTVRLDGATDSLDLGTPIHHHEKTNLCPRSDTDLKDFLINIREQIPPKFSALHVDGVRAYDLARQWVDFVLESRPVTIRDVVIDSHPDPYTLSLSLTISSWGYIRSLAPMIGEYFWVPWWYITYLRRTHIYLPTGAILDVDTCRPLDDPQPLDRTTIFPDALTHVIGREDHRQLLDGKTLSAIWWLHPYVWQKIFFTYEDWASLCIWDGSVYRIIRNDVW